MIKYFAIFDKNVATIFELQWNIENIPYIYLQYSVLCGILQYRELLSNEKLFWKNTAFEKIAG